MPQIQGVGLGIYLTLDTEGRGTTFLTSGLLDSMTIVPLKFFSYINNSPKFSFRVGVMDIRLTFLFRLVCDFFKYLFKPNTYFTLDAPNPAVIALASEMKLTKQCEALKLMASLQANHHFHPESGINQGFQQVLKQGNIFS